MRILHFIPDIGIANGVMSVIYNYYQAVPEDVIFDVMYFKDVEPNRRQDIEARGGRVFKIQPPGLKSLGHSDIEEFFQQHQGEYDALHIHTPYLTWILGPKAKKYGITNIIAHGHTAVFSLNPKNNARNRFFNCFTKHWATTCIAASELAGKIWFKKNFVVLRNAIDCEKYRFDEKIREAKRRELGLSDQLVLVHMGKTIIPQKNHPYLLRVFAELLKREPNAALMLIAGTETEEMTSLMQQLAIPTEKVLFLGIRNDVPELLMAADAFAFPSTSEGLLIAAVEAQAAGLRGIISDGIPKEVSTTPNVEVISLQEEPRVWADRLNRTDIVVREKACDMVKQQGWDIRENVKYLLTCYKK